jgi:hypothetical protein
MILAVYYTPSSTWGEFLLRVAILIAALVVLRIAFK